MTRPLVLTLRAQHARPKPRMSCRTVCAFSWRLQVGSSSIVSTTDYGTRCCGNPSLSKPNSGPIKHTAFSSTMFPLQCERILSRSAPVCFWWTWRESNSRPTTFTAAPFYVHQSTQRTPRRIHLRVSRRTAGCDAQSLSKIEAACQARYSRLPLG